MNNNEIVAISVFSKKRHKVLEFCKKHKRRPSSSYGSEELLLWHDMRYILEFDPSFQADLPKFSAHRTLCQRGRSSSKVPVEASKLKTLKRDPMEKNRKFASVFEAKARIMLFVEKNKRLPSIKSENVHERSIAKDYLSFISRTSPQYDSEFKTILSMVYS